ncbi:MAG: DJ-1/PfpI family protein [Planctomycetales bacterium]|nr:DJ-1/PfpI family protein [Planctomycetales bacterium]
MNLHPELYNVAILIFDDIEILDFCGPYEVFSVANRDAKYQLFNVYTVAKTNFITARGGLTVRRHFGLSDSPQADLLLVPGGVGVRALLDDSSVIEWVARQSAVARHTVSVCTGALLLGRCGLLDGRPVTTHHRCFDELSRIAPRAQIRKNCRFVDDGRLMTSAGISAGIDMSLHIVGRLVGPEIAAEVAGRMEYEVRSSR